MNYITNAFSLQMLNPKQAQSVSIEPIEPAEVPEDCVSAIGHADTANVVSSILNRPDECPAERGGYPLCCPVNWGDGYRKARLRFRRDSI